MYKLGTLGGVVQTTVARRLSWGGHGVSRGRGCLARHRPEKRVRPLALDGILREHRDTEFALSAMTASELLHGVHRTNTEARKGKREAFVEALLSTLPVISFDLVAARAHARLWAKLASKGAIVGQHDLIIGATAISRGLDLATRDARSFPKIPGLSLLRW